VLKVGQDEEVRLFVRVRNRGEDAHEAAVNIVLPPLMEYLGTDSDVSPVRSIESRSKLSGSEVSQVEAIIAKSSNCTYTQSFRCNEFISLNFFIHKSSQENILVYCQEQRQTNIFFSEHL